ncbi:hypothetical protein ABEX25_24210 [Paenibacillus thiaminolyticus]|uniref:hypothetical protein n=1 Tax=Paenibacillus thiaminolyticus TaxID=49283 RepID=UPI003D2A3A5A
MAICIEFELIEERGTVARYRYGHCMQTLEYELEVDLSKLMSGEIAKDTPLNNIIVFTSEKKSEFMAYRVFSKIYKHYSAEGQYVKRGGYYA